MAEAPNNIKRYEPAFMLGFPLPVSLLDTTGATTGNSEFTLTVYYQINQV